MRREVVHSVNNMQTESIQMTPRAYHDDSAGHPLSHKLHMKTPSYSYRAPQYDRSMLISAYPPSRTTDIEVERPQSHGSPRLVISINTSFRNRYDKYTNLGSLRKRIPTFPALRNDTASKRNRSAPFRPNSISPHRRDVSSNSTNRRDVSSSSGNRRDLSTSTSSNRLSATLPSKDRRPSINSKPDTNIDVNVNGPGNLSARQKSTFAMYAKYNDENKANEKSNISRNGGSDIQEISELTCTALTAVKPSGPPVFMSDEKQTRISNWIVDTSKALRIEPISAPSPTLLPVILEQ